VYTVDRRRLDVRARVALDSPCVFLRKFSGHCPRLREPPQKGI